MENQIAGHENTFLNLNEKIAKKAKPLEFDFYKQVFDENDKLKEQNEKLKKYEIILFLIRFIPKYFGILEKDNSKYVLLENLLYGLENSSFIDIKLGRKTYLDSANEDKQKREENRAQQTTTCLVNFRICGYLIKNSKGEIIEKITKKDVSKIQLEDIPNILIKILKSNDLKKINKKFLSEIIIYLDELISFVSKENTRIFRAMSIFIAIDNINDKINIKLIDFGNVIVQEEIKDINFLEALQSLRSIFNWILANDFDNNIE